MSSLNNIVFTLSLLFELHTDGVPNDSKVLANIANPNNYAQLIHPDNLPQDGVTFDDVISSDSISEAGDLMMEIEDRIMAFYVSAHEAARGYG